MFFFSCDFEMFVLFGHGRFVESFDNIAFHHERSDFILEIGLTNIHKRVHLLDPSLKLRKNVPCKVREGAQWLCHSASHSFQWLFPTPVVPRRRSDH